MKRITLFLLFTTVILHGCFEETARTKDYYMDASHKAELDEKITACKADPGHLALTPNCINAFQAQNQMDRAGFKKKNDAEIEAILKYLGR